MQQDPRPLAWGLSTMATQATEDGDLEVEPGQSPFLTGDLTPARGWGLSQAVEGPHPNSGQSSYVTA